MAFIGRMLIAAGVAGLAMASPAVAAETAGAAQASNSLDDNRIICRKTTEVGSLVRKKKECYTKREWDRIAEAQQRGAKRLQDELSTRSAGN
jgi:hypothetical protein